MQSLEFYQMHLDRVSRSFAFCIVKLDPPFRQWISLSYLLCRVLDTVEDSPWEDGNLRDKQFKEFEGYLNSLPSQAVVSKWQARFPSAIRDSERSLLENTYFLIQDLHGLPEQVQLEIRTTVLRMSGGMQYYCSQQNSAQELYLTGLADVNRYCYFVAGTVGELLTRIFICFRPSFKPSLEMLKNSVHFGLFLQKINLLKDQRQDEQEGRYLVPSRDLLITSLTENARGALLYLTELPVDEKSYRTFCAWSLFLGLASLPWIQKSFSQGEEIKISRSATQSLLLEVEKIVQDNRLLLQYGERYLQVIPQELRLD